MNNDIEIYQPDWMSYLKGKTECCHIDLFYDEKGISLEVFNLEDISTWIHEFTEMHLRNYCSELYVRRLITHGSWKHYVSLAHILSSLSTHVGITAENGAIFNMTNDDYWFHMITGVPPSFKYCEKK